MTNSFRIGDRVRYVVAHGKTEKGIVKSYSDLPDSVFVVYNCGGDWDNYWRYTAANTNIRDLKRGWTHN